MEVLTQKNSRNRHEQASTSNDVSISIPRQASEEISINNQPGIINQSWNRCIQKVPDFLRREEHNNKRDYDPAVVSFGPYHHGKPELKFAEDFKPKSLELFVAGSGKDTHFFYSKVVEVIRYVRKCYAENATDKYDDIVFARMMLLDACFIINYIFMVVEYQDRMVKAIIDHHEKFEDIINQFDLLKDTMDSLGPLALNIILRDIFLLENQIPLWFLRLLICIRYGEAEAEEKLSKFLSITLSGESKTIGESKEGNKEPLHLLEAFRRLLVTDCSNDDETCSSWPIFEWLSLQIARIGKACQSHCLSKFQWLPKRERVKRVHNLKRYHYTFRSITDLKAKGIHLKLSITNSLKDIKFKSSYFNGELQLPFLFVSIYTKVFFLNLVAFEMCPNNYTDRTVSTYINFMKSLIESPEDVKELREKLIISNTLGSDEEVVQVYKDIKTFEVNNYGMFYKVKEKIQEHYNSKAKTWTAELIHNHFSSPWTAITLFVAILLLCSTFVQTYFTVKTCSNQ